MRHKQKIIGLDICEEFQQKVPCWETLIGPAGLFNTGTILIEFSLEANCCILGRILKYGNKACAVGQA